MKKSNNNFLQAEDAQSVVIGFVLVLGIILSASTIYLSSEVPEWTKDYEAQHTANVADDFSELKVLIDGIKGEIFEKTTPIKMAPDKVPIFSVSPPSSNLVFNQEAEEFKVIVPVGGGSGGSGNWTIPNSSFTDYYDETNSKKVDTSFNMVRLSSTTKANLILDNMEMELFGDSFYPYVHYYDQLIITNNSVLSVTPGTGVLRIYASKIVVDYSSEINVDSRGYSAGSGTGHGEAAWSDDGGGGAGYGGDGGDGGGSDGGYGGVKYGDGTSVFIQMGSGGGSGGDGQGTGGSGGIGGGGIWLDAENIIIAGTISANGAGGVSGSGSNAGGGGGGAGGGILIHGREVTISGTFYANGGDGGDGYASGDGGGGGGGGRIKIFYEVGTVSPVYSADGGQEGSGSPPGKRGNDGTYHEEQTAYITSPTDITYFSSGYFVSTVYDTGTESVSYGEMTWEAALNKQDLVMKVRTDWNASMAYATPWDKCPGLLSVVGENKIDLSSVSSVSPAAHRYIQYRAELSTVDDTETPALTRTKVNYSFPAQSPILADASGSIKFNSNYLYYPNQEIVYEHGAVIKYQKEGGFMLQSPPIIITNKSGIPAIRISMVDLTGANYSYSGAMTTSVKNTYQNYNLLTDRLRYPNLTLNLTTEYPSVWGSWFTKKFEESGLDESFFDVNVTAKNVEVNLYGYDKGVELYLEKTMVEVEI
jgi:hypothetical protein